MIPKFSVVLPTFNRAQFLASALQSVRAQTHRDFEVIVVDDGSTDGTSDLLSTQRSDIQVLRQANRGPGAARNLGIRHARGAYVAFLDSDDVWFPWTLQTFYEVIARYGSPAMLSGRIREFHEEHEISDETNQELVAAAYPDYLSACGEDYAVGSGTVAIRRDELLNVGGFSEDGFNLEDHDLTLRLGEAPRFVQILAPVTVGWRRHHSSETAQVEKSVAGIRHLVKSENAAEYPGGTARRRARREIIARHLRPIALECARRGRSADAWCLYSMSFAWHALGGRFRFLLGFPTYLGVQVIRGAIAR